MVLFQPTEATVWDFSWYFGSGKPFEIVFWITAIIAIVFSLFLLSSYLNERKPAHFYWGIAFALLWINTHIAIFSGTFATFLDQVPSTLSALMVGMFAVGLFKNVKPDKEKMGDYLLYFVVVWSLVIGFFKGAYLGLPAYVTPITVMVLHVPMAILIIWLPLQTREENGKSALVMSFAGILMSLVGVLLALTTLGVLTTEAWLELIFTAFPFVYLLAGLGFAWGTFVPKRWNFAIPGIELE